MERELERFIKNNNISSSDWELSGIEWSDLLAIGDDYERQAPDMSAVAQLLAGAIQQFTGVHSVRWRLKDATHLMEKIVRKRAKAIQKYLDISVINYREIVEDLIGIRAIHLFKEDWAHIDSGIRAVLALKGRPIAYIREGDNLALTQQYKEAEIDVEIHEQKYRSIHYIITTQPLVQRYYVELQVRTIFEEGWSEVDHRVRYPNFLKNAQLSSLLDIFNGMVGNADEFAGFIKKLADSLNVDYVQSVGDDVQPGKSIDADAVIDENGNSTNFRVPQAVAQGVDRQEVKDNSVPISHPQESTVVPQLVELPTGKPTGELARVESPQQIRSFTANEAAMRAMKERDAIQKALGDDNAVKSAFTQLSKLASNEAAMRAMKERDAIQKALGDDNAVKRAMADIDKLTSIENFMGKKRPFS